MSHDLEYSMRCLVIIILALYGAGLKADSQPEVQVMRLTAPIFKPYSYSEQGVVTGSAVVMLEEVFSHLGQPLQISLSPNYGRAVWKTKSGVTDGFFLASESDERNQYAVFSNPLTTNRWVWFSAKGEEFSPQLEKSIAVGTLLSTNTHRWLGHQGYSQIHTEVNVEQLIQALRKGELKAVFLAEEVFLYHALRLGLTAADFQRQVQVSRPFGIYISRKYLLEHPEFMGRLNQAIDLWHKQRN